MARIREVVIKDILGELDRTLFTRHGFDNSFNMKDGVVVHIVFKERPDFKFIVKETYSGGAWNTTESPGVNFIDPENYVIREFSECKQRIRYWAQRIIEEFTVAEKITSTLFDNWRQDLNRASEKLPNPDIPFNDAESQAWRKKLDELVGQFEKLRKTDKIQQKELDALRKEVEMLKESITSIPKKTWMRAAGNNILNILEKVSTKAGEAITEGVIKALLGGGS